MTGMFQDSEFNQPINTWCVPDITSEPKNFSEGSPLAPENKPLWGTCPPTSIESKEHPTEFTLSQNYPNPFNPSTRIAFNLPEHTHVKLEVFNVYGQLVATLVDEVRQPGMHEVVFDATRLASGLYIARIGTPYIHTRDITRTINMLLIK